MRCHSLISTTISLIFLSATANAQVSAQTGPVGGVTQNGQCGAQNNYWTCAGNPAPGGGQCCSSAGWCGSDATYCGPGCQQDYGLCGPAGMSTSPMSQVSSTGLGYQSSMPGSSVSSASRASSVPPAASATAVTPDGSCGGTNGYTCTGNTAPGAGPCCSQFGFCGSGPQYCMAGCQPGFGICGNGAGNTTMSPSMSMSGVPTSFPTMTATNITNHNGTGAIGTYTATDYSCSGTPSMKGPTSSTFSTQTANVPSPYTGAAVPLPRDQMGLIAAGILAAVGVGLLPI